MLQTSSRTRPLHPHNRTNTNPPQTSSSRPARAHTTTIRSSLRASARLPCTRWVEEPGTERRTRTRPPTPTRCHTSSGRSSSTSAETPATRWPDATTLTASPRTSPRLRDRPSTTTRALTSPRTNSRSTRCWDVTRCRVTVRGSRARALTHLKRCTWTSASHRQSRWAFATPNSSLLLLLTCVINRVCRTRWWLWWFTNAAASYAVDLLCQRCVFEKLYR